MRVPRLTRFALTTWSISTFTCKYYPFDSSNGFWEINMIQQMVSTCSTLPEKSFYISYLFSRWFLVFSKWFQYFAHGFQNLANSCQYLANGFQYLANGFQYLANSFQYLANSFQYLANSFQYLANGLQNLANGFYLCKKQFLDFTEMANKEANALHNIYVYIMDDLGVPPFQETS